MKPYNFKSNDWSKERYNKNELWNSNGQYDPTGILSRYKTNDAFIQVNEIKKYLLNKRNAIDIGCRWGSFGVQLHKIGFKHVYMFEMREYHFKGISYNIDLSRATVYNCAVMDKTGFVNRSGKVVTNTEKGEVPSVAIDDLNIKDVDFIKIDVDGPDRLVLKGCLNTIKKYKPIIYIEFGHEQFEWEKKYKNNILSKSTDLWGILKSNYKEIKGPENNLILVPVGD